MVKAPSSFFPGLGSHIPALDGLRGIAILLVLIYHGTLKAGDALLDRFLTFWANGGWAGVDLFFVISGFLITGILYDSKGTRNYFRVFYARRFLRIFPPYYATLTVLLIVLPNIRYIQERFEKLAGDEIWYWLYLSNFSLGLEHFAHPRRLDVFWSLAIEEQFYIFWPLIVLLFSRRRLMTICVALVGLAVAWRTALVLTGAHPQTVFALTPSRLDALAIGAFVALAARGEDGISNLLRWARPIAIVTGLGVVSIALLYGRFNPFTEGMEILGYTLLALFFGGVLVLAIGSSPRNLAVRMLEHPVLRSFGRYSYALYLFHVPLIIMIERTVYSADQFPSIMGSTLPGQFLFYIVSISVSFLAAWLSWNLYEKHFLDLKRFFAYARSAGTGAQDKLKVPTHEAATVGEVRGR